MKTYTRKQKERGGIFNWLRSNKINRSDCDNEIQNLTTQLNNQINKLKGLLTDEQQDEYNRIQKFTPKEMEDDMIRQELDHNSKTTAEIPKLKEERTKLLEAYERRIANQKTQELFIRGRNYGLFFTQEEKTNLESRIRELESENQELYNKIPHDISVQGELVQGTTGGRKRKTSKRKNRKSKRKSSKRH
jgi:formiminotetrahydrofolate cyclodeaminase